jgi:hypothetical protein
MKHHAAQHGGETSHDEVGQIPLLKKGEEAGEKEAPIGSDKRHLVPRREYRQCLLEQFHAAIGRARFARTERDPEEPPDFTQKGEQGMMGRRPRFCGL